MPSRPRASASRLIKAEDLLSFCTPTDPQIDPSGEEIAFVVKKCASPSTYATRLHIARVDERRRERAITSGPRDRAPRWLPDGCGLLFVREARKGSPQLALMRRKGASWGSVSALTRLPDGTIGDVRISPDGRAVAFAFRATDAERTRASADRRARESMSTPPLVVADPWYRLDGDGVFGAARFRLFVLDIASRRIREINLDDTLGTFGFDWSPDSRSIAATVNRSPRALIESWTAEVVIADVRSGSVRGLKGLPVGPKGAPAWSPDGTMIAFAGRRGRSSMYATKNLGIFAHTLATGATRDLLARTDFCAMAATLTDSADTSFASWFRWMPGSDSIVMRIGWHGSGHLASVDCEGRRVRLHTAPGAEHLPASLASDGSRIALVRTAPSEPPEVCVAEVSGLEFPVRQLTHLNTAAVDGLALASVEERWTRASDGVAVHYWVMRPPARAKAKRRSPAVLEVHGGPHAQYGFAFFHEFQLLAAQGWTVYYSNPRGSKGYGAKLCGSIKGSWGGKDWVDIQAVLREMKRDRALDASRLGIMGGSYGGYMTNWAVAHTRDFVGAISDRCVSNLVSHCGNSDFPEVPNEYWTGSAFKDPRAMWRSSPVAHFSRARTPMLLIHSEGDLRCNIEQSEQIHAALVVQGVPVRFVRYPPETSHGMSRNGPPDLRLHRLGEITRWWRGVFAGTPPVA